MSRKLITFAFFCTLTLMAASALAAPGKISRPAAMPKPAAAKIAPQDSVESVFGRNLVNKVKKGAIYIWAMGPGETGMLEPMWIGSGFIFQSVPEENAAYALTNHHVANDTTLLQCETWDHSTFKAQFVALEPGIDIALIKIVNIPPDAYEVNVLGDSDAVTIGEPGLAIGAPGSGDSVNSNRSDPMISFGLHQTATMRVVSGKTADPIDSVDTWAGWRNELGYEVMTNIPWRFVTQSAINGGNSGGPLYNSKGEVIGLNHANFGWDVAGQNINYTIPINFAKNFAYQILNTGKYEVPWFGMDMLVPATYTESQQIQEWIEKNYDEKSLKVLGIRRDSPALRAGLQMGDVFIEFDGQTFPTVGDLRLYIFNLPIGKQVPVTVKRDGRKVKLTLEVTPKRKYDSEFSF